MRRAILVVSLLLFAAVPALSPIDLEHFQVSEVDSTLHPTSGRGITTTNTTISNSNSSHVRAVEWAPNGQYALAVGADGIAGTISGNTFTPVNTGTTADLNSVTFRTDGTAVVAGGGIILEWAGGSFSTLSFGEYSTLQRSSYHPASDRVYVLGSGGTVAHNYTGQTNFTNVTTGIGDLLFDVGFRPGTYEGLLVGANGNAFSFDGNGSASTVVTPTTNRLNRYKWNDAGTEAYAVGVDTLLHTTDGASFTLIPGQATYNDLQWFQNDQLVLLAGVGGALEIFDGNNFTLVDLGGLTNNLNDLAWHPGDNGALVVGNDGTIINITITLILPDLSIATSDLLAPTLPDDGALVTFVAIVRNLGSDVAFDIGVHFRIKNITILQEIVSLDPGGFSQVNFLWDADFGVHGWNVTVDQGDYIVEENESNNFASESITVNARPSVDMQFLPIVFTGSNVTFDGTGSTDPDGTIQSYTWDFGDSTPTVQGSFVTHVYTSAGTYTVGLDVVDDSGSLRSGLATIDVIDETFSSPVAVLSSPLEGGTFADDIELFFDGSSSYDTNFPLLGLSYSWVSDALGDIGSGAASFNRAMPIGDHTVTLLVTNGHHQAQTEVNFTIIEAVDPADGGDGEDGGDGTGGDNTNTGVQLPIPRSGLYFALAVVLVAIIGLLFVLRGSDEDEVQPSGPSGSDAGGFTQYADEAYGPMYTEYEQYDGGPPS